MITKEFKCNTCEKEFEKRVGINDPNPKCECGSDTHWLPKLNQNEHQISYTLRVMCDGFSNKIHKQRVV